MATLVIGNIRSSMEGKVTSSLIAVTYFICHKLNADHQPLASDVTNYIRELFLDFEQLL